MDDEKRKEIKSPLSPALAATGLCSATTHVNEYLGSAGFTVARLMTTRAQLSDLDGLKEKAPLLHRIFKINV